MQWREAEGGWSTQQAQWLHEGTDSTSLRLQSHRRFWDASFCHELLREVGHLIPYDCGEVVMVGNSAGVETVICHALSLGRHSDYYNITDSVREFCLLCAPTVVAAGYAAFEIILWKPEEKAPKPKTFRLAQVQNYRNRFGSPMQYQPGRGWVNLDRNMLVVFEIDNARRAVVRNAMELLADASRHKAMLNKMIRNPPPGYDFEAHQESEAIRVSRATRALGWNSSIHRMYLPEPYMVSRYLKWCKFRLELREMMIGGLNRALKIAGSAMEFNVQLKVSGLPMMDDLAEARGRLEDGRCGTLGELIERSFSKGTD